MGRMEIGKHKLGGGPVNRIFSILTIIVIMLAGTLFVLPDGV